MEGENRYEQQQQQQPLVWKSQGETEIKPDPNYQKCPRDSSSSRGSTNDSSSTVVSSPRLPLAIVSACGNVRRVGTLNFTRPQPLANDQPQLKFVRVDINSMSLTQEVNKILNPYMASPQAQALIEGFTRVLNPYMTSPQAQGQSHPCHPIPNGQYHQASFGQGLAGHLKPSYHLGTASWDTYCLNTHGASHYTEPDNANIFWGNSNQIGHSHGRLSGSSSGAWSAQLPGYGAETYFR